VNEKVQFIQTLLVLTSRACSYSFFTAFGKRQFETCGQNVWESEIGEISGDQGGETAGSRATAVMSLRWACFFCL